ncbi:DNA polymerase III subunit alpha, partial [Candidatus Epulonipiscioides saccharophilum]
NMIYGRNCEGKVIKIADIIDEIGEVVIEGEILNLETREIRASKTIIFCDITDYTDTITFKIFVENEEVGNILADLKKGGYYKVKGSAIYDKYDKEISLASIKGIKLIKEFKTKRMDNAPEKRVELHMHTKMSDMDSVVDIKGIIKRAKEWGMSAIAITDHGCLQAFPIANHAIEKDDPFKIIYGVEAYFVDDNLGDELAEEAHSEQEERIKKLKSYHGIILVKNEVGRINLNKLVSAAHLKYYSRRPKMPKSLISKYREGLIIGSACEAGEIFSAILEEKDDSDIEKLIEFYDYLEIQPILNNEFLVRSEKYKASSLEDLRNYNRKIIELGEKYNKRVVATCDVHFIDPEDEIYRCILMDYKGFKDADLQPPLYFRTTNEMLEEFSYLGEEKAYEVVVENTNQIADEIEKISPVLPDKCPPIIADSDKELRKICYDKAHEIYGPDLPEQVTARLERELNSIINNGYAVMYIIAQKLVWDSNDHGYLVGSRGSVGSSFAATMAGITEVNPLAAHYICPECFYTEFQSNAAGISGCDMPDKACPKCGSALNKEGHDIPFETFLGFYGDKEPDIDLNFSGEYQSKAHKYVEVLFGEGKAFRAGTIGTVADKTALMYVFKYLEKREMTKRKAEMRRIAAGCTGVKRTTGQHPGGIIVVPHDRDIYEFCAIQHPANDVKTPIITTHYEYHSIDHNLLKLDILGHDDPTIIRRLEDLTGISSSTIKLDDKEVMKLFHGTEVLGITPDDISGIKLGSLGVPEFGTDFVIQMLIDAKPQNFSDLVRISGLSHGTDVWLGNAQTLIEDGKGTISTVICTRDDIMTYLISMDLEAGMAFSIMESVRKGKGLKPDWEKAMIEKKVPDWYIWSCKKIKYMFPKAHAAAYVMMAWRIAWYKVFYPLEYYTAFFSIRASSFNYELMCFGKEKLENNMKGIMGISKEKQTAKDQDLLKDMRIVQEMYARGFEFKEIDIFEASDVDFKIIDGKIMPSLGTIDGMGDKAAALVVEAAKDGPFLSKDDFKKRTKVTQTVIDKMSEFGMLGDIPESNQLSLIDIM